MTNNWIGKEFPQPVKINEKHIEKKNPIFPFPKFPIPQQTAALKTCKIFDTEKKKFLTKKGGKVFPKQGEANFPDSTREFAKRGKNSVFICLLKSVFFVFFTESCQKNPFLWAGIKSKKEKNRGKGGGGGTLLCPLFSPQFAENFREKTLFGKSGDTTFWVQRKFQNKGTPREYCFCHKIWGGVVCGWEMGRVEPTVTPPKFPPPKSPLFEAGVCFPKRLGGGKTGGKGVQDQGFFFFGQDQGGKNTRSGC